VPVASWQRSQGWDFGVLENCSKILSKNAKFRAENQILDKIRSKIEISNSHDLFCHKFAGVSHNSAGNLLKLQCLYEKLQHPALPTFLNPRHQSVVH